MKKLSKAMMKPNETSRKKSQIFERKKRNLEDDVYKSLLRIIILPQFYSTLINTELNAITLSVIYKFKGFVCIPSSCTCPLG